MSMSVAVEVEENEESETVALLRRHEREKIRANKLLKSLRFKLDSARGGGVDSGSGVVIRKAAEEAAANKVVYDFSDDSDSEIIDHSLHVVTIDDYSSSPKEVTNYPPPKAAQNEGVEAVMMRSNIGEDENNSRNREMVVRMMRLLWERNKAQTRTLNELAYRVEHMEKACSKLYRNFCSEILVGL
nr:BAG family molecular chaperone regulator 6-like [Ipomoea batatas]